MGEKRIFDIVFSFLGLVALFPLMLVIAFLVKRSSLGPVFYQGARVGKGGKMFKMYKFRTMIENAEHLGGPSTAGDDPRLTKTGKFLRKYKLDELPQLFNVLTGKISFVGPRPEVLSEIETLDNETKKIILSVKPGLTSPATLRNCSEGERLRGSKNPHKDYCEKIKPIKMKMNIEYVKNRCLLLDIKVILKTIIKLICH